MGAMPETNRVSSAEAAALLGLHVSAISRFVREGKLVPVMRAGGGPGGAFYFDRTDVEALCESRAS